MWTVSDLVTGMTQVCRLVFLPVDALHYSGRVVGTTQEL